MEEELTQFDVAVVGGGIIGLAVAARLAKEGKRVALIDRGKCHAGASANSHRIIHGGVRYLQNGDLTRLSRSLNSQQQCLETFPDSIKPFRCYLPISGKGLQKPFFMKVAAFLYQLLSGLMIGQIRYAAVKSGEELADIHPWFQSFRKSSVFSWDDARLVSPDGVAEALKAQLVADGGVVKESQEVLRAVKSEEQFELYLSGDKRLSSRAVVFALGNRFGTVPVENVQRNLPSYKWTKAFNLVLNVAVVEDCGVGFSAPSGQVLFFSPRDDSSSAVGTWYVESENEDLNVSESEIGEALADVRAALGSHCTITAESVVGVESGLLPSTGVNVGGPVLESSERLFSSDGVVEILSTKYTTFPIVAEKVSSLIASTI